LPDVARSLPDRCPTTRRTPHRLPRTRRA
jgi:hypothetical protein